MPITPRTERPPDPELLRRLQTRVNPEYTVESELSGGGMSRVFLAQDHALHRRVVIKVLPPSLAATVSVERFRREIMVAARLQHPHIVPVLAAGELDSLPYFVMPFIDGESLRPRIQRGPLSVRETVGVMRDIARALSFAHRLGIIHRDIKPDNILLASGSAVVTDFGVAKAILDSRTSRQIQPGSTITAIGVSLGTPQYMAPEQAAADPAADHRADIYALGIVGYEMLAGVPPFHGRSPQELLVAQMTEAPKPLTARRYDVPVALAQLIMQCLEKDPDKRPKSAADVVRVLESSEAVSGEFAAPGQDITRKARGRRIAIVAATAAIAIGGLVFWVGRQSKSAGRALVVSQTVAIQPFEVVGGVAADSTLAHAVTADLASAVGVVSGLHVTAASPLDAAVDSSATSSSSMLLTGTVQRSGERVRVNVRLASRKSDSTYWTGRFDGRATDMLALEDSIATATSAAIRRQTLK